MKLSISAILGLFTVIGFFGITHGYTPSVILQFSLVMFIFYTWFVNKFRMSIYELIVIFVMLILAFLIVTINIDYIEPFNILFLFNNFILALSIFITKSKRKNDRIFDRYFKSFIIFLIVFSLLFAIFKYLFFPYYSTFISSLNLEYQPKRRLMSALGFNSITGITSSTAAVLVFALIGLSHISMNKAFKYLLSISAIVLVVMTGSRTGILGLVLFSAYSLIRNKQYMIIFVLVASIPLIYLFVDFLSVRDTSALEHSNNTRVEYLLMNLNEIANFSVVENIIGKGDLNYRILMGEIPYSLSSFVTIYTLYGLLGVLYFLSPLLLVNNSRVLLVLTIFYTMCLTYELKHNTLLLVMICLCSIYMVNSNRGRCENNC